MQIYGSHVLLTGASGGIGQAIARALHGRGASLTVTARRLEVLETLRAELGDRVECHAADMARADDVVALAEAVAGADVLVANAALPASGRLDDYTPEQIDRALDVNLRAPAQLARALVPGMVERRRGHLVFISSLSGKVATPGSALYSATKFGIRGLGAGLREDLRASGVGVTTVFPGFIRDAGMWAEAGQELPRSIGTKSPDDVAEGVVRGIERNRGEIDVAPLTVRLGAVLGGAAPGVAAAVNRRMGAERIAEGLADAQRDKR